MSSEKRNISNIVEHFSNINKDINAAYTKLESKLNENKDFQIWKKSNRGTKNGIKSHFDLIGLLEGESNWYYLNCYGMLNDKVVGFTFVIGVDNSDDEIDYTDYIKFIDNLDKDMNKRNPLICIYGSYTPINKENISLFDSNTRLHWVEEILRIANDSKSYLTQEVQLNKEINIDIDYLDSKGNIKDDFDSWFKSAKVKIIEIVDIDSSEKAETIIEDLISM